MGNIIGNIRDWHESGVRIYNGMPAIDVKVHDPIDAEQAVKDRLGNMHGLDDHATLIGEAIDVALESLTENFWDDVRELCAVVLNGYDIETGKHNPLTIVDDDGNVDEYTAHVTQQGRSGGWLVVTDWPDVDDWNDTAHQRWGEFVEWVQFYYKRATDAQNIGAMAADWIREVGDNRNQMQQVYAIFTDALGGKVANSVACGPYARVTVTTVNVYGEHKLGEQAELIATRINRHGLTGYALQPNLGASVEITFVDCEVVTDVVQAHAQGRFHA